MLVEAPYIHRAGPVQPVEYLVETLVVGEYRVEFLLAEFGVLYHDIYVEMAFKLVYDVGERPVDEKEIACGVSVETMNVDNAPGAGALVVLHRFARCEACRVAASGECRLHLHGTFVEHHFHFAVVGIVAYVEARAEHGYGSVVAAYGERVRRVGCHFGVCATVDIHIAAVGISGSVVDEYAGGAEPQNRRVGEHHSAVFARTGIYLHPLWRGM